ncbi:hypothetical protein ACOKGC_18120 [Escherichia coli]|uniref:hypothetical protein n=1 Tax=Escherichia coli TaxID=562 RepID=UPI003EE37679
MMSLWDALRMNMMISYQELVRTFPKAFERFLDSSIDNVKYVKNIIEKKSKPTVISESISEINKDMN